MGNPAALTRRWVLVVKPPRERSKPAAVRRLSQTHGVRPLIPFAPAAPSRDIATQCPAGQRRVRANHRTVDDLKCMWHRPTFVQGVYDLLPEIRQCPTPELPTDAGPLTKLFRQVAPRRISAGDPENPIKCKAVVGRLAPVRSADSQDEPFKERPLLVQHQVSCQAGLHRKYQLESHLNATVMPFCQHG